MDVTKAKRIVAIDERRRALEDEIQQLKEERRQIEETLLEELAEAGVDQIKADGRTLYTRSEIWASAQDIGALRAYPDTAPLIKETVNGQTLSAWVRELERTDEGDPVVPQELQDAIKVSKVYKIATRKG